LVASGKSVTGAAAHGRIADGKTIMLRIGSRSQAPSATAKAEDVRFDERTQG
jgi:hypothetical protein